MNKPAATVFVCTALAFSAFGVFVASPAVAQEATFFADDMHDLRAQMAQASAQPAGVSSTQQVVVIGRRQTTRDEVMAQVAQAIADGTLDRSGEVSLVAAASSNSKLTRADVLAEVAQAKAEGRYDASGEHWIGHDHGGRDPRMALAAAPSLKLAAR